MKEVIIIQLNDLIEISENNSRVKCYSARKMGRLEPKVASYPKPEWWNGDYPSVSNMNPS